MIQSHTATQQWQSFEMKMRRRRLERCLLRASAALDAGVYEDAGEALEEAAGLDPDDLTVQELAARLTAARAGGSRVAKAPAVTVPVVTAPAVRPPAETAATAPFVVPPVVPAPAGEVPLLTPGAALPADVPRAPSRVLAGVLALALIALSGVAGWWWTSTRSATSTPGGATAPKAVEQPTATAPPPRPIDPSVRISETAVTAPVVTAEAPPELDTPPVATTGTPAPPTAASTAAVPVPDPRGVSRADAPIADTPPARATNAAPEYTARPLVVGGNAADARVTPAPALPAAPPPAPPPAAAIVPATEGIAAAPDGAVRIGAPPLPEPSPASAPSAAPAAATPGDEQIIRGVLARYEAAYSRLDAAAASAVWPGVNQRALASAFQGLHSQSISLGRCDVRVNGATAQAQCSGSARWTPKVGGGVQSAARQWRFDLRNSGGNWVITQATTR